MPLAPEIDEAALVGFPVANSRLGLGGQPTEVYLRTEPDQVQAVAEVLSFTANPAQPDSVQVSGPSQLLAARAQAGEGAHRQVGLQFLTESVMLPVLGGIGGVILGAAATSAYALATPQSMVVPLTAIAGGVTVAISVGLLAGVYPALRAARPR